MISEFFMQMGADLSLWLTSWMVWDWVPLPAVDGSVAAAIANFSSMGVWIPFGAIFLAVAATLGVWLACLGVKALRALLAHVPQIGGAG